MGIFNYSGLPSNSKGVSKNERQPIRPLLFFMIYIGNFFKFITSNILFVIACIPIVTFGPAIAGITDVYRRLANNQHAFVWQDFYDAFKDNFFKGLVVSIIDGIIIYSNFLVIANYTIPHLKNLFLPLLFIDVIFLIMNFYLFPMMTTYDLPLTALIKNSFIFTLVKLPFNLLIAFIFLLMVYLIYSLPVIVSYILIPLVFISFIWFFVVFSILPTLTKYMEGADIKHNSFENDNLFS